MAGVEDECPVEEFSTQAANSSFHDRVCAGRLDRSLDDLYARAGEDRVAVADQEPELRRAVAEIHDQISGLLSDPVRSRMCSDTDDMHAGGGVLDNREKVQPGQQHGVAMKNRRPGSLLLAHAGIRPMWDPSAVGTDRFRRA